LLLPVGADDLSFVLETLSFEPTDPPVSIDTNGDDSDSSAKKQLLLLRKRPFDSMSSGGDLAIFADRLPQDAQKI
jgi:hypothetical protein